MNDDTRYVRVGAFVFGGIALAVVTTLVIGGGRLFERPIIAETVFDESVQGLDVGSPVKLRGVKIGSVSYIGLVGDNYSLDKSPNPTEEGNRVLVRMKIDEYERGGVERDREQQLETVKEMTAKGLRLRITPLGLTGTSFVQADYLNPNTNPPMELSFEPDALYIPSAPSTISQLSSGAERLVARIDKLDVEKLLTNFDSLLVNLNAALGKADVEGARKSVGQLLDDLRSTSGEARKAITSADLHGTTQEARQALDAMSATLVRVQRLLDASSDDLGATLDNLRVTSQNLRDASETARAYPSYLLFGAPPKPPPIPAAAK